MRIIYYIYFKIFQVHSHGEDGRTAAGLSVMTISFIFFCNFFSIGSVLKKTEIIPRFINNPIEAVALIVACVIFDYFIFMHKKKYLHIKDQFAGEKNKIIGGLFVLVYCLVSFMLVLLLALFRPSKFL